MAEWKEDLERAFNIMNEELIKAEYKARVGYYWKYMDEIMEEVAKETKSYKQLEEENKKLKAYADNLDSENDNQAIEIEELKKENKKLKEIIKDHQLYEEKLEHRIIEFEELLHWE